MEANDLEARMRSGIAVHGIQIHIVPAINNEALESSSNHQWACVPLLRSKNANCPPVALRT